jgi:AcrR family transcriptional regulator
MQQLVEVGSAELNLHDVAAKANVSKALIHYHFSEKESLLARMVEWSTREIVGRQDDVFRGVAPSGAVDAMWGWVSGELDRGDLKALVELGQYRAELVQVAVKESIEARKDAMARLISHLFGLLELRPRVPAELLAAVVVAFVEGLATQPADEGLTGARAAFDVFWLAILNLAE